jgi:hypothetical protein
MTTPIDPFERRLPQTFTDLAAARTPDYLIDILGQTARTRQRPAWASPGRWNPMLNLTNRPSLALLTVVLLAVVAGGAILLNGGNQSGVGGPSTPAPTNSPSPSPVTLSPVDVGRSIEAGRYRVGLPFDLPLRFSTTSDWRVGSLSTGDFIMIREPAEVGYLSIDLIEDVVTDPCRSDTAPLASPRPSTVDEYLAALGAMERFTVTNVTDIVIDGHAGKEFDLSNSLDPETSACDGGALIPVWTYRGGGQTSTNPGSTDEHGAIIDVDGTLFGLGWTATDAQADQLARGLDFE